MVSVRQFLARSLLALVQPIWTPERDEKLFPAALAVIVFAIRSEGALAILAVSAAGWIGYVVLFWGRLGARGERKRFLIASGVVFTLLLAAWIAAALV